VIKSDLFRLVGERFACATLSPLTKPPELRGYTSDSTCLSAGSSRRALKIQIIRSLALLICSGEWFRFPLQKPYILRKSPTSEVKRLLYCCAKTERQPGRHLRKSAGYICDQCILNRSPALLGLHHYVVGYILNLAGA